VFFEGLYQAAAEVWIKPSESFEEFGIEFWELGFCLFQASA
jgi:hypothetical protein